MRGVMKIVPGNETGGADGPRVPRKSAGRNRRNGTGWCAIDGGESTPRGLPGGNATLNHSCTSDKAVELHPGRDCSWRLHGELAHCTPWEEVRRKDVMSAPSSANGVLVRMQPPTRPYRAACRLRRRNSTSRWRHSNPNRCFRLASATGFSSRPQRRVYGGSSAAPRSEEARTGIRLTFRWWGHIFQPAPIGTPDASNISQVTNTRANAESPAPCAKPANGAGRNDLPSYATRGLPSQSRRIKQ